MKFTDFIPKSIIDYLRIIRNKHRFSNCKISTANIGKKVVLGKKVSISRSVYVYDYVEIGDYTYVHDGTMIVSGKIGKFCSIAFNCQIGMWEHPKNYISTSPFTYASSNVWGRKNIWKHKEGPIIGNDVWIGSNAIISRGIIIGNGAIIGAGTIVTKDIPPYAIVVGSPGRVIKYRFDKEVVEFLNEYKWWDLDEKEFLKLEKYFMHGDNGVKELMLANKKNDLICKI